MKIQSYVLGMVHTNCYIVSNDQTKETIVIDPPDQALKIKNNLKEQELNPVAVLLTHGHFDHIMAAGDLADFYHIPVYASEAEKELLEDSDKNGSHMIGKNVVLTPDKLLQDNEIISLAGINIKVIHTPGHTAGGVCYYLWEEKVLFSGDTLFYESVGRTDLPTGDMGTLIKSIREKLMALPDEVKVYPGHGDQTTIGHERIYNPYLGENNFWDL